MSSLNGQHKKIFFLVPYPFGIAPGQRFRYEQYLDALKEKGFTIELHSFLSDRTYTILYTKGNSIQKIWGVIKGFFGRLLLLPKLSSATYIFIFREATPVGPPVFEWIIAKVLKRKIIYDFDDAIWLTDRKKESMFLRIVKWRSKVAFICSWSYKVSCGNEYLCDYARQFAKHVIYNPTTIDTEKLHTRDLYSIKKNPDKIVIGWTGSHSTLKYLKTIESELATLEKKYPTLELLVIADRKPELALRNLKFIPWSFEKEITGLLEADIGIMPLPDDEWAKGKCGFKALQYLALEIPAVISRVGVNVNIVEPGQNGFLCSASHEWITSLEHLIADETKRQAFGKSGRQKVIEEFSVLSNTQNFLNLFT
jgi:glycosyltransferase involved in cell wall biosynthesis